MLRPFIVLALAVAAAPAAADLYRYRDPETGQIKLTNVPPVWMKHRPQAVQVIPAPGATKPAAAAPQASAPDAPSASPAGSGATLPPSAFEADRQRQLLLQQLVAEAPNVGTPAGRERFLARLGNVIGLETRLDKVDPSGRKAREAERDRALGECSDGFAQALKDPSAQREFTGELLRFLGDRVVQCARGPC
jgi:hypothetical protein